MRIMTNLKSAKLKGKNTYVNTSVAELIELAVKRGEGVFSDTGAFAVSTGKYTGRSPKDRFIVRDSITEDKINWGKVNLSIKEEIFDVLYNEVVEYLNKKDLFIFNGFVGSLGNYKIPIRVTCEYAYQAMFANQMFVRPTKDELSKHIPEFNIISAPGFKAKKGMDGINSEAFIIINFTKKVVLIGGTSYSGEIKKSVFSIMNFLMPQKGVLPMHCSANKGEKGDTTIFFGLSGTGKTTLSADLDRKLIGDDEHGWCNDGVFNFEGGCYAKVIRLDKEKEREIYNAIKFGTLLENVALDENRKPDYNCASVTENTRAAYPINYIENFDSDGFGKEPNTIIFLTADAFGVMPPISKLTKEQAMYHFISGYTSKVPGTERGVSEPKATFSTCFGEPFMILKPSVYAKLLGKKIDESKADVYLINTGWIGGSYGEGQRIKLSYTRKMVNAAISGKIKNEEFVEHPVFKVLMPKNCEGVPGEVLNPRNMWKNKEAYDVKVLELAKRFKENFKRFEDVSQDIVMAGPSK
nr:phosphoenolpyruvate carboxykinase (ATP) [Clostridium algifaecis]